MNKAELINQVGDVLASKAEARAAVDCVFETITETLKRGDSVRIAGFGTFRTEQRNARTARNPQTGDPVTVPAKKVPKFLPGKSLSGAVA